MIRILQLNCGRSYGVMCELGVLMTEQRVDVALLQEPYVWEGRVRGVSGDFTVVAAEGQPKAAIVVRNALGDLGCVASMSDELRVCVHVRCKLGDVVVCTAYFQFGGDIESDCEYLERLMGMFSRELVIVGADANASAPLWHSKGLSGGGRENEVRGRALEEYMIGNDWHALNEPTQNYTFSGGRGESDIDVTMVNGEWVRRMESGWRIENEWCTSDHNAIVVEVGARTSRCGGIPEKNERLNFRRVNWIQYERQLKEGLDACVMNELNGVEEKVCKLYEVIEVTNSRCVKVVKKRMGQDWWNSGLKKKRDEVRKRRKQYQRMRKTGRDCTNEKDRYREVAKEYNKRIREDKLKHWRRNVTEKGNRDPWGQIYKFCRRGDEKDGKILGLMKEGVMTKTWEESVHLLLDEWFKEAEKESMNDSVQDEGENFTMEELERAMRRVRMKKAPGPDNFCPEILRSVYRVRPDLLLRLMNDCMSEGIIPKVWKEANVVILLKGMDKCRTSAGSYRPICLLSVFGKLLERLMVERVMKNERYVKSGRQYGFEAGRSTEDAWGDVKGYVKNSNRKYVLGVFVDFKGAFDGLEWCVVLEKLKRMECKEYGLWVQYFKERRVCVKGVQGEVWKEVKRGCPQGSICGPLVWNLLMEDLLLKLVEEGFGCVAYADDLLGLIEADTRKELEDRGSRLMAVVETWGISVGVRVSEEKTVCMLLKGILSRGRPPILRMSRGSVRCVETVRYLGIEMGVRMTFRPHLIKMKAKLIKVVGMFRRVLRKEWGLKRSVMVMLYKGLMTACMMYGVSVWGGILKYGYGRRLIDQCERVILYGCLPVCRTVSTAALQVLMGELPWYLEARRRMLNSLLRKGRYIQAEEILEGAENLGTLGKRAKGKWVKEKLMDEWQHDWDTNEKGRVTYEYVKDVREVRRKGWLEWTLEAGYLITGHGSMNGFLWGKGLAASAECRCGGMNEDWMHVLLVCDRYECIRNLESMGVYVDGDGRLRVERVLETKSHYENFKKFAREAFDIRKREVS